MGFLRTDGYTGTAEALLRTAREEGVFAIGRFQNHRSLSLMVSQGATEQVQSSSFSGMAVQVFTPEGYCGFAAANTIDPDSASRQVKNAAGLARSGEPLGAETNTEFRSFKSKGFERVIPPQAYAFDSVGIAEMENVLHAFNRGAANSPCLSVRTVFGMFEDDWRVVRSDGRDVSFRIPRAFVYNTVSASVGGKTASGRSSISGAGLELLMDSAAMALLSQRTRKVSELCLGLLDAPRIKGGHYKIVIDYALAKGLAHEAFGHAAETDQMEQSILGCEGRFLAGKAVAPPFVSIVDGPVEGDYAYQPISANGEPRGETAVIDHGLLHAALADQFSAARSGVLPAGAARAESYLHIPCPRMSNIRLIIDNPLPLPAASCDDMGPEEIRNLLDANGLRRPGETVLFLTGYKGGQVDRAHGDFVFNCSGIYRLDDNGAMLHQPGIFSGKVLSALQSILAGIGPVHHDAMGTCGKRGQGVPSSGGSNAFVVIDANDEITIGGE